MWDTRYLVFLALGRTHGRLRAVEVHFPFFDFFPSILSPVSLLPPSPFSSYFTVTSVRKPQGRDRPGGCWASLCSEHSALRWKLMSTWTSPFHQLRTAIPFNPTDAAVPLLPKYPPLRAFLIGFVPGGGWQCSQLWTMAFFFFWKFGTHAIAQSQTFLSSLTLALVLHVRKGMETMCCRWFGLLFSFLFFISSRFDISMEVLDDDKVHFNGSIGGCGPCSSHQTPCA